MDALRKPLFLVAVLAALAIPPAARAQPEFYVGAGYGRYDVNEDRFDENDTVWKAYAGFSFNRAFAIEASWVDFNEAREAGDSFQADGWGAAAVLSLPLTENFSLNGKAGQFFWDADRRTAVPIGVPGVVSDDGDDPFYGAGVKFRLNELIDLRLEWERYDVADIDLDTAFVMLQASF